jgi:ankyrin repeat protein
LNDSKIRVNDITNKGTALHIACKNVDMDFVKLLLDNNADPQYVNMLSIIFRTRDNHGNLCVDECGS